MWLCYSMPVLVALGSIVLPAQLAATQETFMLPLTYAATVLDGTDQTCPSEEIRENTRNQINEDIAVRILQWQSFTLTKTSLLQLQTIKHGYSLSIASTAGGESVWLCYSVPDTA